MDQMALFAVENRPGEACRDDAVPIRSGRVGSIRFGATETSFALTRTVLTVLTIPPAKADTDIQPKGSS
jgi:hypothetical protein